MNAIELKAISRLWFSGINNEGTQWHHPKGRPEAPTGERPPVGAIIVAYCYNSNSQSLRWVLPSEVPPAIARAAKRLASSYSWSIEDTIREAGLERTPPSTDMRRATWMEQLITILRLRGVSIPPAIGLHAADRRIGLYEAGNDYDKGLSPAECADRYNVSGGTAWYAHA